MTAATATQNRPAGPPGAGAPTAGDVAGADGVGATAGAPGTAGASGVNGGPGGDAAARGPHPGRHARLAAAIDAVVAVRADELDEAALHAELRVLEDARRRICARQTRAAGALAARRRAKAARHGQGEAAAERDERQLRRELQDELDWSAGEAKQATQLGRRLDDAPEAGAAFDAGDMPPANARTLTETLAVLPAGHEQVRKYLCDAATRQDPVTFGRTCRRMLAETDHDAAMDAEQRRYERRRASVARTEDGMLVLTGRFSGADAEVVHTACTAFSTPDDAAAPRSAEQRTADAVVAAFAAALRAGEAPAQHGVRPHVLVTVRADQLVSQSGVVEFGWGGPVPFGEARRILFDAGISRIVLDAADLPLAAGAEVRTVPAGLYKTLLVRDEGCVAERCDAPAAWCDVMHLDDPYRRQGRLSPDNAALGCRFHHRLYDLHGWRIHWHKGRPVLRPPP